MSPVTAADVQALRARTGVSILACKEALEEAGGDQEKAIEILRKRGIAQAVKKSDRNQGEGALFVAEAKGKAAVVSLRCETDFVARSEGFIKIGQEFADAVIKDGLETAKKNADARVPDLVNQLGENIALGEMQETMASVIGTYVHSNRKIAVVVGLDSGDAAKARDVAMHAAAMNPLYVTPDEIPADLIAKEKEIWKEQMKDDKKPPEILEKIMLGKEKKFREENALLKQPFVKDQNQTVEQYLGGAKITGYLRAGI